MSAVRLAIMQPYLFPYLGYFQLMAAVDRWVVYDDVGFIKGGWINRNRLRVGADATMFTVPLAGASASRLICDVELDHSKFAHWRRSFEKTLAQSYARARNYTAVRALVDGVLSEGCRTIAELDLAALRAVHRHLGLTTEIVPSSRVYENGALHGQDRVLDICAREGARTYVNAIGGLELYRAEVFRERGIELLFSRSHPVTYPQAADGSFVPNLSILDVLMHAPGEELPALLRACTLAPADEAAVG